MATRLKFSDLTTYGLTDLQLAPCCWFAPGEDPHFILCSYHEGFIDGFDAAKPAVPNEEEVSHG